MKCPNCGFEAVEGTMYCPMCGSKMDGEAGEAYEEVPVAEDIEIVEDAPEREEVLYGAIAYVTWIGYIVAWCMRGKDSHFVRFHLNQALVLNLASIICLAVMLIPLVGWIVGFVGDILILAAWVIGLISACTGKTNETFLFGGIHILE